jgi:hypothetical protein
MEKLGWIGLRKPDPRLTARLDERAPERGMWTFTLGAPVTGVLIAAEHGEAPEGSLLHGTAYKTDAVDNAPLGLLQVIYDHVEIPGKGKFPVCVVGWPNPIMELKDDKATAQVLSAVVPETSWAPPRD